MHARVAVLTLLFLVQMGWGVEIDPPEVPNPYNVSEARALRDHLTEEFGLKGLEGRSAAELRDRYRAAWNQREADRLAEGKAGDPRYAQAQAEEASARRLAAAVAELGKLGKNAPSSASYTEVEALVRTAREEAAARAAAEAKARQEEQSLLIERNLTGPKTNGGAGSGELDAVAVPRVDAPILAKPIIIEAMVAARIRDTMTTKEIEAVRNDVTDDYARWAKDQPTSGWLAVFSDGATCELRLTTTIEKSDPEKGYMSYWFVNLSGTNRYVDPVVSFGKSPRNPKPMKILATPARIVMKDAGVYSGCTAYFRLDPEMSFIFDRPLMIKGLRE